MTPFYLLAILLGSFLLFMVQPMLGKALLPYVGGAPASWIASMLFFQLLLLVGYGYAALSSAYLTARRQSLLHVTLTILAAAVSLPLSLTLWYDAGNVAPEYWVITTLLATVGLPYMLLSANATLLQRWFFETRHHSPYFLFSISNIGSLLGLLSYPFLIEWLLPLQKQMLYWSGLFGLLIVLLVTLSMALRRSETAVTGSLGKNLPLRDIGRIVLYGFIPSSLFLSTTLFLTTDVASMPLLWMIPLALYLLSFILVFSPSGERWTRLAQRVYLPAIAVVFLFACYVYVFSGTYTASNKFIFQMVLNISCLFAIALIFHGQAARNKPAPEYLTAYYFWLSVGGALGGVFNLLAPHLFTDVYEYPIVLLLSLVALPLKTQASKWIKTASLAAIALSTLIIWAKDQRGVTLYKDRNFFGVKVVVDKQSAYPRRDFRLGNTLQGYQPTLPEYKLTFTSYYPPVKQLLDHAPRGFFDKPFAVLGLGVGTLSCAAKTNQTVDFFEIDPLVIHITREAGFFTYLQRCPATSNIIEGDGRRKMAEQPADKYNLMVMDAFTSDALPAHLLTREAVATYLDKLDKTQGLLAFNISNRHLDLKGVLAKIAESFDMLAYHRRHMGSADTPYDLPSDWVVLIPVSSPWKPIVEAGGFEPLTASADAPLWTDDYSSIFKILK